MRRMVAERSIVQTGPPNQDAEFLIDRGFAFKSGNKLKRPARFLEKFLDESLNQCDALARLFGAEKAHLENFKEVMTCRINQIERLDPTLK